MVDTSIGHNPNPNPNTNTNPSFKGFIGGFSELEKFAGSTNIAEYVPKAGRSQEFDQALLCVSRLVNTNVVAVCVSHHTMEFRIGANL